MSETEDQTLQRICGEVSFPSVFASKRGHDLLKEYVKTVARRYAATVGAAGWRGIASVPEGVEVIVRGGKTVFGTEPRGSSIAVIDDRNDLYRPDGTLRPSSPTMWHPAPAPPSP